ncbi:universal stress protein, partial [Gammaproteobacteria bacterium]|nr:universal stress protein [Gammaproteobacteria bacterium]
MTAQSTASVTAVPEAELYRRVLIALDSSDYANQALDMGIAVAKLTTGSGVTGVHAYAAKLHDVRFRQMEGGLPEQFREEQELERQRDVHDDLITRGLSIITDSYLDQAENGCREAGIEFRRRSLEGKNYRALVAEANSGNYDIMVMGSLGLGAVEGSRLGTVCQRFVRRSDIDTLVIKNPRRAITEGPILVAVDGSAKSYGGLTIALRLAREWGTEIHVAAVFDPYFHYVAFNRIANVLSEEAGKVFRFKEQEKLHEEIIDSGLAKIYQGHLDVAESIAQEFGMEINKVLLDGKPHDALQKYVKKIKPALLVMGKLGVHADPDLDIGGNTEALLYNVDCAALIVQREYQPRIDVLADASTSWTREAERRMQNVPSFVRNMARMAILRYAQERGHTVITERIVEQATAQLMPGHAEQAMEQIVAAHDAGQLAPKVSDRALSWSSAARQLLNAIADESLRDNIRRRVEKKALTERSDTVDASHVQPFLAESTADNTEQPDSGDAKPTAGNVYWQAAALARLMRVPEGFMRDASRQRIEQYALGLGGGEITLEVAEAGLAEARTAMEARMGASAPGESGGKEESQTGGDKKVCPFAEMIAPQSTREPQSDQESQTETPKWTEDALNTLERVPQGFCRDMMIKAANTMAGQSGLTGVDEAFVERIMDTFKLGATAVSATMDWDIDARIRISRAPEMVRGMLIREIEGWAQRNGRQQVGVDAVDAVKALWQERGVFHLDPDDPR